MKFSQFLSKNNTDRVFIFQSTDRLNNQQILNIQNRLNQDFFPKWFSHSKKIFPELLIISSHFISISTGLSNISGCAIDSLNREMKQIELEFDIRLFDRRKIAYYMSSSEIIPTIDTIESIKVNFLNYKDFIHDFNFDQEGIFDFNNTLTKADDTWIFPLNKWRRKYN